MTTNGCFKCYSKEERNTPTFRLGNPYLTRAGTFGVYGAGARGNQPRGRPRPLAQKGIRGYEMCCAGLGAAANIDGPGCCPLRTCRSSTYQGRLPKSNKIAGRTQACGMIFVLK